MTGINEHDDIARELNMVAMTHLAGLADHAEEVGLGDLGLYFTMARTELALGPWNEVLVPVPAVVRPNFAEGVSTVLELLDALRLVTVELSGVVALALARLWMLDAVRRLDRLGDGAAQEPYRRVIGWRVL